ncbi:MAG: zinc metalloprotease [Planctomycetota bacterium]
MLRLLPLALIACIGCCCYCSWPWGGPEIYFMGTPAGTAWDNPGLPDVDEGEPKPPRNPSDLFNQDGTLDGSKTWPEEGVVIGDSDADGLTDDEELVLGTLPDNPDTDGDALLDGWEVKGVDGLKLFSDADMPDGKADPLHKDIFVEMDYMVRLGEDADTGAPNTNVLAPDGPTHHVLQALRQAFRNSPVENPDELYGINLHLDLSNQVEHATVMDFAGFYARKYDNFPDNRLRVFHYMIWIDQLHAFGDNKWSGMSMNVPSSDFVVSLGLWSTLKGQGGDHDAKVGTFMHELGHNLGLRHGGDDDVHEKPNHLSVMNYTWQTTGLRHVPSGKYGVWRYQMLPLPALDETTLDEKEGVQVGGTLKDLYTAWYYDPDSPLGLVGKVIGESDGAAAVDWSGNELTNTPPPVEVDLNNDGIKGTLAGTPNEYLKLKFAGGAVGAGGTLAQLVEHYKRERPIAFLPELTRAHGQRIRLHLKYDE